jgi:SapC protein
MSAAPDTLPDFELLDPERHRHLRLRPSTGPAPHFVQIVVSEFASAAACCPILLTKEAATGAFYAGAMFGFKPGESFFETLTERNDFVPLSLQRDGFFIAGEHIAVDRHHARFSETDGELLFDDALQPNRCLRQIQRALGRLQAGMDATNAFVRVLAELKLIEPIDVSLNFGGELLTLQGLYTVSLDGLRELEDAAALRLLRSGHLQLAYMMNASLKQIPVIARLRDRAIRRMPSDT